MSSLGCTALDYVACIHDCACHWCQVIYTNTENSTLGSCIDAGMPCNGVAQECIVIYDKPYAAFRYATILMMFIALFFIIGILLWRFATDFYEKEPKDREDIDYMDDEYTNFLVDPDAEELTDIPMMDDL